MLNYCRDKNDETEGAYRSREGGEELALEVTPDLSYAFCREK